VSRRSVLLAVAVVLAIGAAFVAGILVESEEETTAVVDRPADTERIDSSARTVRIDETRKPKRLSRALTWREIEPEEGRLPPLSQAELVESTEFDATELQDRNDPRGTDDAYGLFANALVNKGNASFIAEPTVAAKGDRMLVVWNWGAAFSNDGGESFGYVHPPRAFPPAAGGFRARSVWLGRHRFRRGGKRYDVLRRARGHIHAAGLALGRRVKEPGIRRRFAFGLSGDFSWVALHLHALGRHTGRLVCPHERRPPDERLDRRRQDRFCLECTARQAGRVSLPVRHGGADRP
jgi:hypothetical protein